MLDAVRCHKRWGFISVIFGLNALMGLMFIATLLLNNPLPDPFFRIFAPTVGFAFVLMSVYGVVKALNSTLYVLSDGVGVQYKRGSIKKITWDNIDIWVRVAQVYLLLPSGLNPMKHGSVSSVMANCVSV